jgi:hypothetical protein
MPIPDNDRFVYQIAMKGVIAASGSSSVNTANIFYFRRTSNINPISKTLINTAFQGAVGDVIAAALNLAWAGTVTQIRCMDDAEDPYADFSSAAVGAISGDRMPSYVTAFLNMRTGLRGRRFRGSKKLGPFSESDSTTAGSDVWNAGALTRITAIASAIAAGFIDGDGNDWQPVVLCGPPLSQILVNPTTIRAEWVTQVLVNHRIGTLLRRKTKTLY